MNDALYLDKTGGADGVVSQAFAIRIKLAERSLGANVIFKRVGGKEHRKGRVVFADYDSLNVLIDVSETEQRLVSLKDCRVLTLRDSPIPVLHGARLDVWQHGEDWRGVGIADVRVADAWLEPLCEPVAA